MMDQADKLRGLLADNVEKLTKVVLSKPCDAAIRKAVIQPVSIAGRTVLHMETLRSDNKAIHQNIECADAPMLIAELAQSGFRQTNLIFTSGQVQVMVSAKGRMSVVGSVKDDATAATPMSHDKAKNYIIDAEKYPEFLCALGVCDQKGNVFDKKRSKYRQINRFVELLDDVYDKLPKESALTVCDLCCGKSYLTFAVYFYLTKIKGREVALYGVDLKADVIKYCQSVADRLGCGGMHFLCQDVMTFDPPTAVDLVISLHACDIATDVVLAYAMKKRAKLVLSTPCCHHEVFHQLDSSPLHPIMKHSILKQKFADALTDSLRALYLEAEGYHTEVLELIDPEETPKNVMIRAYYTGKIDLFARREYENTVEQFGLDPTLRHLMEKK